MSTHYDVKQMCQTVTFCGDYLYPIAHLCIIESTQGATWFIKYKIVVLNILKWK